MSTAQGMRKNICRRLRWKGMFIEAAPDPTVPNASDGFFWCAHTMNCLGPDGEVAEQDHCRPGRGCYEKL
jgi:hypothetical protein